MASGLQGVKEMEQGFVGASAGPDVTLGVGAVMLSEEDEERLLAEFNDTVLTAGRCVVEVGEAARDVVALLGCGDLLVAKSAMFDLAVPYVERTAIELGIAVRRRVYVSKRTIVRVYAAAEKRLSAVGLDADVSRPEAYLVDLVDEAVKRRATDIHLAVRREETEVELRVDGMLESLEALPRVMGMQVLRRAWYGSSDSQGGTFKALEHLESSIDHGGEIALPNDLQAIRCQFDALARGCNYLVMRLVTQRALTEAGDVDELGYSRRHVETIRRVRHSPYGLVLIAGVTSSGKSTTLHVSLERQIQEREGQINVVTIEDPVESEIRGAKQMTISGNAQSRGAGFAAAIAAALRSDPDVIMVGEVREALSANAAVTATQTGHQVWTTVHAISATTAIERLISEGVPAHRLLDPVVMRASVAQRLVPRLCAKCALGFEEGVAAGHFDVVPGYVEGLRERFSILGEEFLKSRVRVRNLEGCSARGCRKGYGGRTLIAEVLEIDEEFLAVFRDGGTHEAQRYWLRERDGLLMAEHGLMKVCAGLVDPLDLFFGAGAVAQERMSVVVGMGEQEGLIR